MKKKILVFISVLAIILVSIFSVLPNVNADTNNVVIEYGEYNYIISITDIDNDYYYFYVVNYIVDDNFSVNFSPDTGFAENNDLITSGGTYLVNASMLSDNPSPIYYYYMHIDIATPLQSYLNTASSGIATHSYNKGYTQGVADEVEGNNEFYFNAGEQYAYDSLVAGEVHYDYIYDKGVADTDTYYSEGNLGYNLIFQSGYNKALRDYDSIIGEDEDLNFLSMFKVIVNYITDFFRVGLNVEIFGVNIGNFCMGIFIISAVVFLIRLIFGR